MTTKPRAKKKPVKKPKKKQKGTSPKARKPARSVSKRAGRKADEKPVKPKGASRKVRKAAGAKSKAAKQKKTGKPVRKEGKSRGREKRAQLTVEEAALMSEREPEVAKLPSRLGIIPLRDTVIFPYMIAPLVIGRPRSLNLVDEAANSDRMVGLATQLRPDIEVPSPSDLYTVGTAATILKMLKLPDGNVSALVTC